VTGATIDRALVARVATELALEAGEILLRIYAQDFAVEYKSPGDPVTLADHASNAHIVAGLTKAFPGIPIVAEESAPSAYAGFERAPAAFFVDPLDGTREFVGKNGEFTVMIGLAEAGRATVGVVGWPAERRTFAGFVGGDCRDERGRELHVTDTEGAGNARALVSRSRGSAAFLKDLEVIGAKELVPRGSSGLKASLVAAGEADLYVHPGSVGYRWDLCASEAIVRAAGGETSDGRGQPIDYGDADLANHHGFVASNGKLHAEVIARLLAGSRDRSGARSRP
jgi:3'(2'), 5'-bisphosphate nucleotidase